MASVFLTVLIVIVLAAILVGLLKFLVMAGVDATLISLARYVILVLAVLYVLAAFLGLFTGHAYVPLIPLAHH